MGYSENISKHGFHWCEGVLDRFDRGAAVVWPDSVVTLRARLRLNTDKALGFTW